MGRSLPATPCGEHDPLNLQARNDGRLGWRPRTWGPACRRIDNHLQLPEARTPPPAAQSARLPSHWHEAEPGAGPTALVSCGGGGGGDIGAVAGPASARAGGQPDRLGRPSHELQRHRQGVRQPQGRPPAASAPRRDLQASRAHLMRAQTAFQAAGCTLGRSERAGGPQPWLPTCCLQARHWPNTCDCQVLRSRAFGAPCTASRARRGAPPCCRRRIAPGAVRSGIAQRCTQCSIGQLSTQCSHLDAACLTYSKGPSLPQLHPWYGR